MDRREGVCPPLIGPSEDRSVFRVSEVSVGVYGGPTSPLQEERSENERVFSFYPSRAAGTVWGEPVFLALELPDALLDRLSPLADFDWILAHKVIDTSYLTYIHHYKKSTNYKVLDNSVNELLEPVSLEYMVKAAEKIDPDIIVAPDWLLDREKTLEYLDKCEKIFPPDKILPVIQGKNLQECVECMGTILGKRYASFAVPFDLTCTRHDSLEKMAEARYSFIDSIETIVPNHVKIHLLGLTLPSEIDRYTEDWSNHKHVFSLDTGSPILHGLSHILLEEGPLLSKATPTMRQMERVGVPIVGKNLDGCLPLIYRNLAFLRKKMAGSVERS
jgi:hypothetical protein